MICIEFDVDLYSSTREHSVTKSFRSDPDVDLRAWLENIGIWNISNASPKTMMLSFSIL